MLSVTHRPVRALKDPDGLSYVICSCKTETAHVASMDDAWDLYDEHTME